MMDAIDKNMAAVKLLYPNYISSSNGVYFDIDGNEITINADDVDAKIAEINSDYSRLRKAEYSALNQFEMQFDDQQNNTTTWVDAINDIKARFPK